jgi:hypothetical protein
MYCTVAGAAACLEPPADELGARGLLQVPHETATSLQLPRHPQLCRYFTCRLWVHMNLCVNNDCMLSICLLL